MINKTGKISLLLLATCFCMAGVNAQTSDSTPKKPNPEKMFKRMDVNNDGKIDKEEASKQEKGPFVKRFDKIDSNKDGIITMEEWKAFQSSMRKKPA